MNAEFSGWYEFAIICPDGKREIVKVFGSGFSPGEAFVDAKDAAGLRAAENDDAAHLACGTHQVGRGREATVWR